MSASRLISAGVVLALACAYAFAHGAAQWIADDRLSDPISKELCCGEMDCVEEPAGNVVAVEGGYLIKSTNELIARERIIWRSPGGWWRCHKWDNSTRCLIGPPPGS